MKKYLSFLMIVFLGFSSVAHATWNSTLPGTTNISDVDARVTENYATLEQTLSGGKTCKNVSVAYATSASITVTADQCHLQAASAPAYRQTSISETIAITTSGAGGLVSSLSELSGTYYYVWIARKSADSTVNGYLSTTADFTTFLTQVDSGYDQAVLVSVVRNDGSSNFISFKQSGDEYCYTLSQSIYSGTPGSSWVAVDTSAVIPSGVSNYGHFILGATASTGGQMSNENTQSTAYNTNAPNKATQVAVAGTAPQTYQDFYLLTADTVYAADTSAMTIYVAGFRINKL